jgi:hypothetical protein
MKPIFGRIQYFEEPNIWQKTKIWKNPISARSKYLSKANICQKPIFVKRQYLAKANIW